MGIKRDAYTDKDTLREEVSVAAGSGAYSGTITDGSVSGHETGKTQAHRIAGWECAGMAAADVWISTKLKKGCPSLATIGTELQARVT